MRNKRHKNDPTKHIYSMSVSREIFDKCGLISDITDRFELMVKKI